MLPEGAWAGKLDKGTSSSNSSGESAEWIQVGEDSVVSDSSDSGSIKPIVVELNVGEPPVPIWKAWALLKEAVRKFVRPKSVVAGDSGLGFMRWEVGVNDIEDEGDAILWLRGQGALTPKVFFRNPDRSVIAAGIGAAHLVKGHGDMAHCMPLIQDTPLCMRYYGGGRFDPSYSKRAVEWEPYGGHYLILPALELVRTGLDKDFVLACNLRWEVGQGKAPDFWAAQSSLVELLHNINDEIVWEEGTLPPPVGWEDAVGFDEWNESISKALEAMRLGRYRKVALARTSHFHFPCDIEPLDLVSHLRSHYGYLFCLQLAPDKAFLGCTPEQLLKVDEELIATDALAGTRPRGSTPQEDARLADELMASQKDRYENEVTAEYIEQELSRIAKDVTQSEAFILKLTHVQHICKKIRARPIGGDSTNLLATSFELLKALHPTPAVGGQPRGVAISAIRDLENWDRGYYAGPVGYFSGGCCEVAVAIRSVLVEKDKVHVFAGAGIVPGSTAQGEWSEIGAKMKNFVKMFPSIPPLRGLPNINTLWATLVVEELVRNGVSHFCICPGSRSTPLVVAVARHPKATSFLHHDERGGGFYCVGYARATGRTAAIITTSGTAVANLLPAVVEASIDCLPMMLLTADRASEDRDRGSNQTIKQPGIFGDYVRWCKDVPPPSDDLLASTVLSDVDYALSLARGCNSGPVHLNFMYRENLAPEGGPIRDSPMSATSEWSSACLNSPRITRWERDIRPYTTYPILRAATPIPREVLAALESAKRGLLVVGRLPDGKDGKGRVMVAWLAQQLRWPVFADIGSGLRREDSVLGPPIVGLYDQILLENAVSSTMLPDFILQIGAPIVSKRLSKLLGKGGAWHGMHVVVTPHPARQDPEVVVSHQIVTDLQRFGQELDSKVRWHKMKPSELLPFCHISLRMEKALSSHLSSLEELSEPFISHCISRNLRPHSGLFLSNSMAVRDMDMFCNSLPPGTHVGINRGASGIDGILSSAMGFAQGSGPATLVIGDMAFIHDLNALHAMSALDRPLCIILINNQGGGIFSFLPIAKHDVFSPHFDSPHAARFPLLCETFGISYMVATTPADFEAAFIKSQAGVRHTVIEALTDRSTNVKIHRDLGESLKRSMLESLAGMVKYEWIRSGPGVPGGGNTRGKKPTLLLLHGWLGCKEDWEVVVRSMRKDYDCLAVDLLGHGRSSLLEGPWRHGNVGEHAMSSVLYSMDLTAFMIMRLLESLGIMKCAILGYSMGGRLAALIAKEYPDRVSALVVISAHPGLKSPAERLERQVADSSLAKRVLSHSESRGSWEEFLRWWYTKPLWGRLAEKADTYSRLLNRRVDSASCHDGNGPKALATALEGMGVARQPSLWPFYQSSPVPLLYLYGASDLKYAGVAEEIASLSSRNVEVRCLEDTGHALVAERPLSVAKEAGMFLSKFRLEQDTPDEGDKVEGVPRTPSTITLVTMELKPFTLPLKSALHLSAGEISERHGIVIAVVAQGGCRGYGEAMPLPGFHAETIQEVKNQLHSLLPDFMGSTIPISSLKLDGSMTSWINMTLKGRELYPSVRIGLEMALLHVASKVLKTPLAMLYGHHSDLTQTSHVRLNGLADRKRSAGGLVANQNIMKLKVGGRSVKDDVTIVNDLIEGLQVGRAEPLKAVLRLDANQAWTYEEALEFLAELQHPQAIEYIEEPIKDPTALPDLFTASEGRVQFALDESLYQGVFKEEHLRSLQGIGAVVLKPTLLGSFERCLRLRNAALSCGMSVTLTSAFESSITLMHLAIFASVLGDVWKLKSPTHHGLSTHQCFVNDIVPESRSYASALLAGRGLVDVAACQKRLNEMDFSHMFVGSNSFTANCPSGPR